MNIRKEKQKIFSKIASVKVNSNSLLSDSTDVLNSLNVRGDSTTEFLMDLLKNLDNTTDVKEIIIDAIHRNTEDIENSIKTIIKKTINEIILCFSSPTVRTEYTYSDVNQIINYTRAFKIPIESIDFFGLLKIDPNSEEGKLLYFDDGDMNKYLYNVVTSNGAWLQWGTLIYARFSANNIEVLINKKYIGKQLGQFFFDLVESIDLYDAKTMLNKLIDSYSATLSYKSNKTSEQVKSEVILNTLINRIIEEDDKTEEMGYFTFSNSDNIEIEDIVSKRLEGVFNIDMPYESLDEQISFDNLKDISNDISNANPFQIDDIISKALSSLGTIDMLDIDRVDIPLLNLKFIEDLIKNLSSMITSAVMSPKVVLCYNLANKMAGFDLTTDSSDFLKSNINIIKDLITTIKNLVIGLILERVIKLLKEIVFSKMQAILSEKINNRKAQLSSLIKI